MLWFRVNGASAIAKVDSPVIRTVDGMSHWKALGRPSCVHLVFSFVCCVSCVCSAFVVV